MSTQAEVISRRLFLRRAGSTLGVVALLPALGALPVFGSPRERYFEHTIIAMGTTARLGVYAKSEQHANAVITKAFTELKRLEALFSVYLPLSDISRVNEAAGRTAVTVDPATTQIIESARRFSTMTDGAFDITIEPLMRLWGFRNDDRSLVRLPEQAEIDRARALTGSHQIAVDGATVMLLNDGARLDLGGIAVGYALDQMREIVMNEGITDAFIDISGDVVAIGAPHGKSGWEVSIPDPRDTRKLLHTRVLKNEALATSGNYMNFVVYQAARYGHIMDPRLGAPAHTTLSATAIHPSALTVDALSTAAFVSARRGGEAEYIFVS